MGAIKRIQVYQLITSEYLSSSPLSPSDIPDANSLGRNESENFVSWLFSGDDGGVHGRRQLVRDGRIESGFCEHVRIFGEGVGVAFGGGGKHDDAESGGHRRRDTIRVGDEFHDGDGATRTQ